MRFEQRLGKVDMIIQHESGYRQRFSCDSETDFVVRAFKYALDCWIPKGEFKNVLAKELKNQLDKFNLQTSSSFTIGGLLFIPTKDCAWN